jgi:hypothetical protein
MTVTQRKPPARQSGSHGPGFAVVRVETTDATNHTCICRDSKNYAYQVRTDVLPAKGVAPQPGEHWIITKQYGDWLFSHVYTEGFGGGGTPTPPPGIGTGRRIATYITQALEAGGVEQGVIALSSDYRILYIQTSHPARVRLYVSQEAQQEDVDRDVTTQPRPGLGIVMDYLTADVLLEAPLSPVPEGATFTDPLSKNIPISVTSVNGDIITVTLTWVAEE